MPFLLALNGIISSILGRNFNFSLSGAPQIGQGVFWYFDIVIMTIIFSQILHLKTIRIILFINITIITLIVSFFTFFPYWQGIPISFYYFTDYLCFYGVLNFILLTTITKNRFIILFTFILLGKDGTEKLRRLGKVVSPQELFQLIDSMPMRKAEMATGN